MKKEYGLILAGGGTKGAFQVGVWKALKELKINITGIAGVSIGALNGALFLQNDLNKVETLYKDIKLKNIMEISKKFNDNKNIFNIENIKSLAIDFAKENGIDNTPLKELIEENIDIEKIHKSKKDLYILAYNVKKREPLIVYLNDIEKEKIVDYLLASACFPIFKPQIIDGEEYLDGGLYDNTPVNILIDKGYKNIIIADVSGIGAKKKIENKNNYIKLISPSEEVGGTFEFNHKKIQKNMLLGYLDTMRAFNKLSGHIYYFKNSEFIKMMDTFNLNTIYGLEYAAKIYEMDKYKIYTFKDFIVELTRKHLQAQKKYNTLKKDLNIKRLWNFRTKIDELFNKGLGLCIVKDLYMDNPLGSKLKYLKHYVNDYVIAAQAIIEMKNYTDSL